MPEEALSNCSTPKRTRYKLSPRKRLAILGGITLFYPACFLLQLISMARVIFPYQVEVTIFSDEFMQFYIVAAPALLLYLTREPSPQGPPKMLKLPLLPRAFRFLLGGVLLLMIFCVGWMFRLPEFFMLDAFAATLSIAMVFCTVAFCILVFRDRFKTSWQKSVCFLLCSIQVVLSSYLQTLSNINSDWLHNLKEWQYVAWVATWPLIEGIALCGLTCIIIRIIKTCKTNKEKNFN